MTDTPAPTQWIDVSQAEDLRDVVHRAVACLAQGGLVGLATETVYGLVASALHAESVSRVRALRGTELSRPLTLLLKGPDEVIDWVPEISILGRRMAGRLWPGPATLIFPRTDGHGLAGRLPETVKDLISPTGEIALRCPASPLVRDVLRLLPAPLVISMIVRSDQPVPVTADCFRGCDGIEMVLDAGPTLYQKFATVVRIDESGWQVEREGVVDTATVIETASLIILFVCTGNTCRSPMAEGICKVLLARRLQCAVDDLEKRGYVVCSAGVAASTGDPAATHAVDVVRGLGGMLDFHRSRRLDANLARRADFIFAMTADHLDALLDVLPEVEPRAFLLDPHGRDLADPFGSDRETYRRTAATIEGMLAARVDELGI